MSYFWSLSINQEQLVACAVHPYAAELSLTSCSRGGWGLGCYHIGEVLQRIEPSERGEALDVEEIVKGLEADLVIMHVRRATVGSVRRENTHPFRFKDWLFAHNGTLNGFESFREKMQAAMPGFLFRNIRGDTDSEYLFHLFLSFLYDAGQLDRPDLGGDLIRSALNKTFSMVEELSKEYGHKPAPGSAVVSDGYSMVICSRGIPVDYIVIEDLPNCKVCRSSIQVGDTEAEGVHHKDIRAILIKSSAMSDVVPEGFTRLAENSCLLVNKDQKMDFVPCE